MANEDVLITPASEKIEFKQGDPQATYALVSGSGTSLYISGSDDLKLYSGNDAMKFYTDGTQRVEFSGSYFRGGGITRMGIRNDNPSSEAELDIGGGLGGSMTTGVYQSSWYKYRNSAGSVVKWVRSTSDHGGNHVVYLSPNATGNHHFQNQSEGNMMSIWTSGQTGVYIGTSPTTAPIAYLDVAGKIAITSETTTPTAPADGKGWLYTKSDGKLYWQSYDIAETDLTGGGGASSINDLSDALVENNSIWLGDDPSSTTSSAEYNVALGIGALDAITTADSNVAIGYNALTAFTTDAGIGNHTAVGYKALESVVDSGQGNSVLGYQGALNLTDGDYNVVLGLNAMHTIDSGSHNIFIGRLAGSGTAGTVTDANIGIGTSALQNINGADNNVVVGRSAGENISTGGNNIILGYYAGNKLTTEAGNVAIGHNALEAESATAGNNGYNVAVGYQAMRNASGASSSVAIGYQAAVANDLTGDYNTTIGAYAGYNLTSAPHTVLLGFKAGYATTTQGYNVFIGSQAASGATSVNNSVVIGREAMSAGAAEGDYNVVIGSLAGQDTTSAANNVLVGAYAGNSLTTQGYNTVVGTFAGQNTTSTDSVYLGYNSGYNLTANKNVMVGRNAGTSNASTNDAENSVGIGYYALNAIQDGHYNVAIGSEALRTATSAGSTVAIGESALGLTTTGSFNVAVGRKTLYNNTIGEYNTAVGHEALNKNVDGDNNTAIGYNALYTLEPSNGAGANTAVGMNAGRLATTGTGNVFMGYNAAYNITDTVDNVIIGKLAGEDNNENYNVFIGSEAAMNATSVASSVAIGRQAMGVGAAQGNDNVAIGYRSMYDLTTGVENVAVGHFSLPNITTGYANVSVGRNSLNSNSLSSRNTAVGHSALQAFTETGEMGNVGIGYGAMNSVQTGSSNVAIGYYALKGNNGVDSDYNVAIGSSALNNDNGGDSNVAIGYKAGFSNTTGTGNVFIGHLSASGATATDSNKLFIHNTNGTPLIGGDFSTPQIDLNGTVELGGALQRTDGSLFAINSAHAMDITIDNDAASPSENLDIKFGSGGSGKFRFTPDGRLCVGSTSITAGYSLDVRGKGRFTDDVDMASETDLTVATTPLAQMKDDTGFIMQDTMGIRNNVSTIAEWIADLAGTTLEGNVVGYGKVQVIKTDTIDPGQLLGATALKLYLPAAVTGMEYIVTFGTEQSNLSGKGFSVDANGSELIYKGGTEGPVSFSKNTGESLHVSCFATGKWSVVAHT